ncbi:MAG: Stf0 family sulfotransferase [Cyanobacteria bacterium P01_H01_bin.21]
MPVSFTEAVPAHLLPVKSVIICSTGRSGSTLLCKTLSSLNCIGKAEEFFIPQELARNSVHALADELYQYLPKVYQTGKTPNQVFGVKLHWDHMTNLAKIARTDSTLASKSNLELLTLFFPNPCFIFIRRNNLAKQAISMEIARQTGVYTVLKGSSVSNKKNKLVFKPLNIYRYVQGLKRRNENWVSFFNANNVPFFEVVYEDLVREFPDIIQRILSFADIELPEEGLEITQATKKQGNDVNERWLRYYQWIPETALAYYSDLRSFVRQRLMKR